MKLGLAFGIELLCVIITADGTCKLPGGGRGGRYEERFLYYCRDFVLWIIRVFQICTCLPYQESKQEQTIRLSEDASIKPYYILTVCYNILARHHVWFGCTQWCIDNVVDPSPKIVSFLYYFSKDFWSRGLRDPKSLLSYLL